jgi:hypothetical protein
MAYVYRYTLDGRHKSQTLTDEQAAQTVPGYDVNGWVVTHRDTPPDGTPKRGDQIIVAGYLTGNPRIYEWEE